MSTNKRIRKPRAASAQSLLDLPAVAPKPKTLKAKASDLEMKVHRLEVEIAATSRIAQERKLRNRNVVPPPDESRGFAQGATRLTHAQSLEKRRKLMLQILEFSVTALLFIGGCAWLYKWWLARMGA